MKAAQATYPVAFDSATAWITRLAEAHAHGRLVAELRRLNRYRVLVIDLCRARDYAEDRGGGAAIRLCRWAFRSVGVVLVSA